MYARIITAQVQRERLNEATRIWREQVGPLLRQQRGFQQLHLYMDRGTGKVIVIIHYASKGDMEVGQQRLQESIATIADLLRGPPEIAWYEIAV